MYSLSFLFKNVIAPGVFRSSFKKFKNSSLASFSSQHFHQINLIALYKAYLIKLELDE